MLLLAMSSFALASSAPRPTSPPPPPPPFAIPLVDVGGLPDASALAACHALSDAAGLDARARAIATALHDAARGAGAFYVQGHGLDVACVAPRAVFWPPGSCENETRRHHMLGGQPV